MAGCCNCQEKALKLYKGYPSEFADVDWLSIVFESEPIDLTNFEAKFVLGDITREWGDITQGIIINLTDEETGSLPVGLNYGTLIVTDKDGNSKPFSTAIPIEVLTWVEGNQELDTYNMTVNALLDNEVQMVIRIETAKVSLDWVNERIAEHNASEEAHPYIQGLIDAEATARENADEILSGRITENTERFNNYRTSSQQDIIDNRLSQRITENTERFNNYRTSANQDIIDNAQNDVINSKQNKLNTEQMEAVNSGITSIKVSSYDSHISNTTIHVTAQDKQNWNAKQNALNQSQMEAVNSGATSDKINQIATNKQNISNEITDRQTADGELQDQIDNLKARGRFLALWNCATGLAESNPPSGTYTYQSGDYFIVGVVASGSGTNYRPNGSTYTTGVPSTTVETEVVDIDDVYYYDGNVWRLQVNTQKTISFVNIAGSPYDNTNLANALNNKVTGNTAITGETKCKITYDSKGLVTAGSDLQVSDIPDLSSTYATAAQGAKADTAIQDVKVGGVSVVNNQVANILAPCVYRDWS